GHISKAGDADVRTALYTAANSLMTRTVGFSTLKAWGMQLMKTKGRRVAVIAVARKLAVILHRYQLPTSHQRLY
ncbi:MAG: IS110 family transposase, partial [Gammaproteobacteria bacterium]|nr:IS110 family transposase [Gammaproteobacteria bacterium]